MALRPGAGLRPAPQISAHFAEICGASVSRETVSRITDKVIEEMNDWAVRPLDAVYAAVLIDAIVKVRDGQVANRQIYAAIGAHRCGAGGRHTDLAAAGLASSSKRAGRGDDSFVARAT